MTVDFDQEINRAGTAAEKWDGRKGAFGTDDVIPMWVGDMDFAVPEAVTRALAKRVEHPIHGYALAGEDVYDALRQWHKKRHEWDINREWITLTPGIVPTIYAVLHALTKPGDGVIAQTPVYSHLFTSVTALGRRLILNPLRSEKGHYEIDFDHFEKCAAQGVKLFIFCSPHNPVGRVWSADELRKLLSICRKHKIIILVDEVFNNLIYPGYRHIPLASLAEKDDAIVTLLAPSKTFNISGLVLSAFISSVAAHHAAIIKAFELLHLDLSCHNPLSLVAFEAVYREGDTWLDELTCYLLKTRDRAVAYLAKHVPDISVQPPEGTYLLWLDCRKMKLSDEALKKFFVEKAKLGLSPGIAFGREGSGFMRMNIAAPVKVIDKALEQIGKAFKDIRA